MTVQRRFKRLAREIIEIHSCRTLGCLPRAGSMEDQTERFAEAIDTYSALGYTP